MPAMTVSDPAGRTLDLAALRGTPVLLNLWATWCAPCVKEMPLLDALAGEYDGRLRVLTVSQDMQGAAVVEPFFATGGYARLEPWMDPDNELGFTLGGGVMPTTVLYDAAGEEVWRVQGGLPSDWRQAVDAGADRVDLVTFALRGIPHGRRLLRLSLIHI